MSRTVDGYEYDQDGAHTDYDWEDLHPEDIESEEDEDDESYED
ncbi:hypothetical protein [Isoalcanivorax pacificus]|nr:hypothetical protein [Isoalcanivorax pacificus]